MNFPPRLASHVPTIKCSDCGREIDLSFTENHNCSAASAVTLSSTSSAFAKTLGPREPVPNTSFLRPQRPVLPKIDSSVALPPPFAGELTPASSGNGSVGSPVSATSARKSPWRAPRKTAAVVPRAPPSPELTNLDCAFPPFPTTAAKAAPSKRHRSTKHPTRTKTSKSRPQSPSGSTRRSSKQGADSSSHSRTASPTPLRQRSKSSPWNDDSARPPAASTKRRPSISSLAPSRKGSKDETPPMPLISPSLSQPSLERAETAPMTLLSDSSDAVSPKPGIHRFATADDIPTLPIFTVPTREPSYKAKRPPPIISNMSASAEPRPDLSRIAPPPIPPPSSATGISRRMTKIFGRRRSQSVSSKREIARAALDDESDEMPAPPLPLSAFELPQQAPSAPYRPAAPHSAPVIQEPFNHDHQESLRALEGDSDAKVQQHQVKADAKSVRPAEAMHFDFDWNHPSQISPASHTGVSIAERPTDLNRASIDSASSYGSIGFETKTASSRSSVPSTDELAKKQSDATRVSVVLPIFADMPAPLRPRNVELSADSPTDPLFVDGRLSPIPPQIDAVGEDFHQSIDKEIKQRADVLPLAPRKASLAGQSRPIGPHKGICRGCSKPIMPKEKSVSSADGRLTGRYHKGCFVCWTCKEPFRSAEIHVHGDHPYCAHHYHEAENSLCATCGKGIEGLYMETANVAGRGREKHHPQCLKCTTCRLQLSTDYFELSGKVYCERDAFRLASLPRVHDRSPARPSPLVREYISSGNPDLLKGNNFPERRITRLMTTT